MISNAEEAEISDLVNYEMGNYDVYIKNKKPYSYLDYLARKYHYPVKGIDYYDVLHDHYNSHHLDKCQFVREVESFKDFTEGVVRWFYTAHDVYTAINPTNN